MDFYKILKSGVGVGMSNFDRLFAEKHGGGDWHLTTLTGALPLSFKSKGEALTDYKLYGTSEGAGTETESSEPSGYKLPMTVESGEESTTTPIYIGDSKLMAEEYLDYEKQKVYKQFEISGLTEPLCGISEYKDTLDLSTGTLTRKIKKLVLTVEKSTWSGTYWPKSFVLYGSPSVDRPKPISNIGICSHFVQLNGNVMQPGRFNITYHEPSNRVVIGFGRSSDKMTLDDFKSYLAAQYAAGTPVTVWYVLAEPETSTIPVPSGLTGTIEGYLIQDGTPTPETPIYSTANGVKQADGTYIIESIGLMPTDPPVALPEISTYQGENTLSCSEGLGESSITGYIKGV